MQEVIVQLRTENLILKEKLKNRERDLKELLEAVAEFVRKVEKKQKDKYGIESCDCGGCKGDGECWYDQIF